MMLNCSPAPYNRFKHFWTTKADTCAPDTVIECNVPLLCANVGLGRAEAEGGRTLDTSEYVTGLVLNVLMTDAEYDPNLCGRRPGNKGGYWADTFRKDRLKTGTKIRQLNISGRISEFSLALQSYIQDDLNKLVKYGVAKSVSVKVTYQGNNRFLLEVEIIGETETARVAVSGSRLENSWVWASQ